MKTDHPRFGVHESHCWQNEYVTGCKYGPQWECPARPDKWPHPTYDEDGDNVWLSRTLDVSYRPGRAWPPTRKLPEITYAHRDDPDGVRFRVYAKSAIPEWAIDVQPFDEKAEMKPCPFCGGPANVTTYETESKWSHNVVTFTQVGCDECDYHFATEAGEEAEALERWNTRMG